MDAPALTLRPGPLNLAGEKGLRADSGSARDLSNSPAVLPPPSSQPSTSVGAIEPSLPSESIARTNDPLAVTVAREANQDVQASRRRESSTPSTGLDDNERAQVEALSRRDEEVRNHEAAHAAAGGALTGAPTYSFTRGPDGRLYAIGGEVRIDTSAIAGDPEATIDKARTIIQAATAPASPSTQDLRAASAAQAMLVEAQAELNRERAEDRADKLAEDDTAEISNESQVAAEDERKTEQAQDDEDSSERERLNSEAEASAARTREALREYAQQLEDLNRRLAKVQQQLVDTGALTPERLIGELLDTSA